MDNLKKILEIPEEEMVSSCCREADETSCHIFSDCAGVQNLWHKMIQWSIIEWTAPRRIGDHFESFFELLGGGNLRKKWVVVGYVLCGIMEVEKLG